MSAAAAPRRQSARPAPACLIRNRPGSTDLPASSRRIQLCRLSVPVSSAGCSALTQLSSARLRTGSGVAADNCQVIEALEREWRDALCRKDMAKLRSLVHPDFVLIGTRSSGPFMMTREEWLDAIQRREVVAIEIEVRDATALDQVMVGTVQAKWRLKYLGRE